jgi:energy-coupling factor transport system ATP-binding protein
MMKFSHVFHTYSPKTPFQYDALVDINLTIQEGSFTAIVGHTGSGKSTLIQHLNALLVPTSGTLLVNDVTIEAHKTPKHVKALRQYAGLVFQFPEYQLFEETVEHDVMFGPLNFGVKKEDARQRAHDALNQVGIDASFYGRSPFELSGGERRRVAIAGILAMQPKVLILDEPTAGLDPLGAKTMMDLFVSLHNQGMTIVLVTHDMELVHRYSERIIVMKQGKVISHTTMLDAFLNPAAGAELPHPPLLELMLHLQQRGINVDVDAIRSLDELIVNLKEQQRWPLSH